MARVPSLFNPGSLLGVGGNDPFLTLHREMNRLFDACCVVARCLPVGRAAARAMCCWRRIWM